MSVIKNLHKLLHLQYFSTDHLNKLEAGAALHLKYSNISFKIIEMNIKNSSVVVKTEQGKHLSENYADEVRLIELTRELFSVLDGAKILVHPIPYKPPIIDVVNPAWINDKMLNNGVRIKDIQADTGIDKTNLSAWINGTRPMSQPVKAMFYFYFKLNSQIQ
ncbi:XRE family transcriptional regulator [Pedobacter metabolipauper]|uniref:Uncharacterized protein n=1 Tax=Pedobacter metabolipauper TaxID=425513 RepID=A0A4R6T356_9SPHI|nr:XRE family transcriptional regulator [Pedobacter metabolipauper]TDQ12178.1 hypothetical protein ATK78_1311 [Pedobacter metabolipauper]